MKESEVARLALLSPVVVCEYRSTRAQEIKYRDKVTGKQQVMPLCEHGIEIGETQVRVSERLPDGADIALIKPPFKKGQRCILAVESWSVEKGQTRASGKLYSVEA